VTAISSTPQAVASSLVATGSRRDEEQSFELLGERVHEILPGGQIMVQAAAWRRHPVSAIAGSDGASGAGVPSRRTVISPKARVCCRCTSPRLYNSSRAKNVTAFSMRARGATARK